MKKIITVISIILKIGLIVASFVLSDIDILKISGIINDLDYQEYVSLKNEGILDENNNYVINYLDADKVRVSFAENKLMDIEYYYDDAYTDKIESTSF